MFQYLLRTAVAAALLASPSFAQLLDEHKETIPSAGGSGVVCDMKLENYDSSPDFTLIQGQPRIGGYSFGLSPFFIEPFGSNDFVAWTSGSGSSMVQHVLSPDVIQTWQNITENRINGAVAYLAY